jgi:MFS family permease
MHECSRAPVPDADDPCEGTQLDLRSFVALAASAGVSSIQFWMTVPLAALTLARQGVPPWQIGIVGAAPWVALVLLVPTVPHLANRFGALRVYRAGCWLGLCGAIAFASSRALLAWVIGYGLCGAGIALRWIVSDALVAALSPPRLRGRRIGLFEAWIGATMALGPLALAAVGTAGRLPFALGVLLAAAAIPLALCVAPATAPASRHGGSITALLVAVRRMPAALIAAATCGLIEGACTKLFPVQAHGMGFGEAAAASTVAAFAAGNILTQYPAGRLADLLPERLLLTVAFSTMAIAAVALLIAAPVPVYYFLLLAITGGLTGSLYTFAVFRAGHAGSPLQAMQIVAGISLAYTLGSTLGPMLGGAALSLSTGWGLPLTICGAALGGLAAAQLGERWQRR